MSQTDEPQEHPAAAYYAPATAGPATTKDLTALGVLAFVTAAVATVFTGVVALVLRQGRPDPGRPAGWTPSTGAWASTTPPSRSR